MSKYLRFQWLYRYRYYNKNDHSTLLMSFSTAKDISCGPIESSLLDKFQIHFNPSKLVIDNESPEHATHSSMKNVQDKSETHFS